MRTLIRLLFYALVVTAGVAFVVGALARFADGPVGPFPGGRLHGEVEPGPASWSDLEGVDWLEMQVNSEDPRSVHVWFVVANRALYVPSAFAARKKWPAQVEADPSVLIRVAGHLYARNAVRVTDPRLVAELIDALSDKYHAGRGDPETTWFFRLDPTR